MTQSAKALYRATRKRHEPLTNMFESLPKQMRPEAERRQDDFYPTGQPEAIRGLLSMDGDRIRSLGSVWEPACGDGALVMPIREAGIPCHASDLIGRGCPDSWQADYFSCVESCAPAIITNPPYSLINARDGGGRWLRHTLDMPGWRYLALLLSWDWAAAKANRLGALLDTHPFTRSYLMRWKLDFTGEGSPPQRNAWFVWDRDDVRDRAGNHPDFCWMDRVDNRQEGFDL